eukprot:m.199707 g.199707  ORF g.199707 m.199707 type:complete len:64 (+) comp16848_c1_seq2:1288-1479(+)
MTTPYRQQKKGQIKKKQKRNVLPFVFGLEQKGSEQHVHVSMCTYVYVYICACVHMCMCELKEE